MNTNKLTIIKGRIFNRVSAAAIAAAILFTAVFSVSVFVNAASSFTPRLSAPAGNNQYYYSSKNIYYSSGWGMPNCTAYAYGRAYEILGSKPNLCTRNAEKWYDYNKDGGYYPYGKTAKLGAIACWSYNGGGHVAVVEKIENGTITFSNSEYGGRTFYLTTADVDDANAGGRSFWNFQGYIYLGDFGGSDSSDSSSDKPSSEQSGIYKVNTDGNSILNMRSSTSTSSSVVAKIPNKTLLTVTQVKKTNGYTWGYTTYNGQKGWVALDYCVFIESETTQPTTQPVTQPTTKPAQQNQVGDVNRDGNLDISDVTIIQNHLSQIKILSGESLKLADFDGDGSISVMDITGTQKHIAGI